MKTTVSRHKLVTRICCRLVTLLVPTLILLWLVPESFGQSSLSGENARDIDRVTRTTIEQANAIRSTATVDSVSKLMPQLKMTSDNPLDVLMAWHLLSLNVTSVDHAGSAASGNAYHEQYGPHRTSRALAMVHLAMFEVTDAYAPSNAHFASYVDAAAGHPVIGTPPANAIEAASIIEAAYQVLLYLYPGQQPSLKKEHDHAISLLGGNPTDIQNGQQFGSAVGQSVVNLRNGDGSQLPEPRWGVDFVPLHPPVNGVYPAGQWQIDPVSNIGTALGGNWPKVKPFVMSSANQFRSTLPGPPDLSSQKYKDAYDEVYSEGGDPRLNTPRRHDTPLKEHYFQAKFWAYDATAGLCAPVRLYNQIADQILSDYEANIVHHRGDPKASASEVGRYYALVNIAMADAAIGAWDGKYAVQFWRPISGIRSVEAQKAGTNRVELWFPLGAQQTNSINVINITPPFPSYPSGHAVFGGALFKVLTDMIPNDHGFKFWSDEFNGNKRPYDANGVQQPNIDVYNFTRCKDGDKSPLFCKEYQFTSFKKAEDDNAMSRVWMGVHWNFDASDGVALGEKIGDLVYNTILKAGP
jgi:hypothetical protein